MPYGIVASSPLAPQDDKAVTFSVVLNRPLLAFYSQSFVEVYALASAGVKAAAVRLVSNDAKSGCS